MKQIHERLSAPSRYALAMGIFVVALALRLLLLPVDAGLAFLTFYPATVIAFYVCGAAPGRLMAVLSAIVGFYAFTPPFLSWQISRSGALSTSLFLLSAIVIGLIIERMQRATSKLNEALASIDETERRIQSMVANVNECAIFALDADGRIATWNSGAQRIKGYAADEIIGRHFSVFYPREDQASGKPARELEIAAQTGRYFEEGWRVRKDGSRFWASVTISAVRTLDGRLSGYAKVTRDLTEQRAANEALRQSEAQYRMLIDGVADGVISVDQRGIVHSFSRAAEQMFGYREAQVVGHNVTMLIPERYRARHDDNVARFALQQDPRLIGLRREVVGLRANGREFPMTLALNVAPGDGPGRFVGLVTDLTERKEVERALFEATRVRNAVVDLAPYAIISCDPGGLIRVFNATAEKMLWYRAEDVIGKLTPVAFHERSEIVLHAAALGRELNEPDLDLFEAIVHKARQGLVEEREWTYVRKGGSRFVAQLALTAIHDETGAVTGFIGLIQDVSERKRREEYTRHIAHHDHLTGLPNRLLLDDRLLVAIEHARRNGTRLALMLLDLDHFKQINDSLGHHIGDELLKVVAQRLKECVRASDTVARLGGDEFVVLLDELQDRADAERVAEKMVASIGMPVQVIGHDLQVTPSIGLNFYPDDAETPAGLLKNADIAMYRAKADGRGRYRLFGQQDS